MVGEGRDFERAVSSLSHCRYHIVSIVTVVVLSSGQGEEEWQARVVGVSIINIVAYFSNVNRYLLAECSISLDETVGSTTMCTAGLIGRPNLYV